MTVLAALSWPIWECIHVVGDFAISPHGIGIALGVLAGAVFALLLLAERRPRFDGFFTAAFVVLYGTGRRRLGPRTGIGGTYAPKSLFGEAPV